jgi:O-acetyl-ADP-ribose deacetylase (regulator of RNase III)
MVVGDITDIEADAIVNAANSLLMGGGGVDGAIHRKAGPKLHEECKRTRATEWPDGLPIGKVVMTSGGNLKAKYVIHTVGPVWHGGFQSEEKQLAEAYGNSLKLARSKGLKTIAFPAISTGAFGYPIDKAAHVAVVTVKSFLEKNNELEKVIFVLFSEQDLQTYKEAAKDIFSLHNR